MPNLSTPIGELQARYDVVVIGSGYGGAVVARWMAEAAQKRRAAEVPFSVCLLERGLEIRPGQYPTSLLGTLRAGQADTRYGHIGKRTSLFDVRMNRDLTVLVGCGLGGTSLINASVILEPKDFNDQCWPKHLRDLWPEDLRRDGALTTQFDMVKKALGAVQVPTDVVLDKVTHLITSAGLDPADPADPAHPHRAHHPEIAVSFTTRINDFGVQQARCTLCGNCITGCNYSAKNTLIMNYLPAAADAGASIFCGVQVSAVEPTETPAGDWLVHARLLDRAASVFGNPEIPIRAGMVFLASGTLGSTEILLRSRERYGLLLSPALGQHFSGNGDVIAFGYNTDSRVNGMAFGPRLPRDASVGPTIAGMLDERDLPSRAMIQEGAVPGALGFLLRVLGPFMARLSRLGVTTRADFSITSLWRELNSLLRGSHHGSLLRTQTFLGMSFDDGRGFMGLVGDRLRIAWRHAGDQPVFAKIAARLAALTQKMNGAYVVNPIWSRLFGRRLVIAHPLGGCALSDHPQEGVVNSFGQVYQVRPDPAVHDPSRTKDVYRGLYVCDGAIIPTPLGTNPSLTIAALAQRIAEHAEPAIPHVRDANGLERDPTAHGRTDSTVVGLRYAERLRGSMRLDGHDMCVELFLHMSVEDLDQQQNDQEHTVQVIGVARAADLEEGTREFIISEGHLNVLIDDQRCVDTKLLMYQLKLTPIGHPKTRTPGEGALWLRGHKTINYDTCKQSTWKTATHLPFVIYRTRPGNDPVPKFDDGVEMVGLSICVRDRRQFLNSEASRAAGIVGVGLAGGSIADVLRLTASMHVTNEPRFLRRILLAFWFQWQFIDALIQARVWGLRRTEAIDPLNRNVKGRPQTEPDKVIRDTRTDGPERYILTPIDGPEAADRKDRPPVLLIPGFSMSTYWFRAPTKQQNITEFLREKGYDVWLLDYRASDRLKASRDQFTLDDLAKSDFPDALQQLFQKTGKPVQVIAHCVGSLSILMSLLSGRIHKDTVHSMILSQACAFIDQPFVNRLKAKLHLAEVLQFLGFRPVLTPDFDLRSSLAVRLLDRLLYFYPSRERCKSGVCRRLLLIYGEANRHAQLDRPTHEMIYDMVDRGNLTTLAQLQRMAVQRRIVDAKGKNVYLRCENGKNVNIPITLLQGERNNLFRRSGAQKTLAWLCKYGGFDSVEERREKFALVEVPEYGHMDVFIGKDAAVDVYPKILTALQRMKQLA